MQRIGVRELRQHASRYLGWVKAGQTVEVTERGQLVALLVPPTPVMSVRARLVQSGQLIPGSGTLNFPIRVALPAGVGTTSSMLDEEREDRF